MNIYIGNLSFNTTENQLREAFEAYGSVSTCNIITDRETGDSRGFAFVEMPGKDEAQAAISGMSGQDLGGRTLTVSEAKPRTESGNRSGGNHYRNVY